MRKWPLVPTFVSLSENLSWGMGVGYFQSDPDRKFHSGHQPEIDRLLEIGGKRGCADRQANYVFIQHVYVLQLRTNFRPVRSLRIPADRIKFGTRSCMNWRKPPRSLFWWSGVITWPPLHIENPIVDILLSSLLVHLTFSGSSVHLSPNSYSLYSLGIIKDMAYQCSFLVSGAPAFEINISSNETSGLILHSYSLLGLHYL
jgi:hypothetical protein